MAWTALLRRVAEEAGVSPKVVRTLMEAYWAGIKDALAGGESVRVPGWGVFRRVELKPKVLRTAKDGVERFVPSGMAVRFRPSRRMRTAVASRAEAER